MPTLIARNDAAVVRQVTTLTPGVANNATYSVTMNSKRAGSGSAGTYTADASATAQEIVEGLQPLLAATTAPPEFIEATFTEDNAIITATGPTTGKPITIVDASAGGGTLTVATPTVAKSPNHWIAENFSSGALPVNSDDVILTQLTSAQSFKWGLDQNAVNLGSLDIRADSEAEIGLPEYNTDSTIYYQTNYRDTHLKISAAVLKIGDGKGNGSKRIKINLGSNVCAATVYKTSTSPADIDEAAVHLIGANAGNSLQVLAGTVDLAMIAGSAASTWPTIVASGGTVRCGEVVTLTTVEASGSATVETRSAVTTWRSRDNGLGVHIGSGNITTLDINGGTFKIKATGTLTIATLNGYGGKTLDLSECDSLVTITNATIYATPAAPFTIKDPNNKLVMTNPASTPNGAQSLVVVTGSGRNVRIT